MATGRRVGTETSKTRVLLLDVTQRIMLEDGYAAVSSRSVAERAGVTAPLVHYYFPTLDDLFLELFRRRAEQNLAGLTAVLKETNRPLRAIWEYGKDKTGVALTAEFLALANHRKAIRGEIAEVAERFRRTQYDAVAGALEQYGLDPAEFPPEALLLIMSAIPRVVVIEEALGMATGHDEANALVERYLDRLEGTQRSVPESSDRKRARQRG